MEWIEKALNFPPLSRIRRNHALEHATLQMLARKNTHLAAAGYSDTQGFLVIGSISTDQLRDAVNEALHRLRNGEESLAVHPNCGTNFATAGMVAGTLGWLAMLGTGNSRSKLERWPVVVMLATLGTILAQPLGLWLQANVTTDGDIAELEVTEITRFEREGAPMHRVRTIH
jgi:hypothetical protein